MSKAKNFVPFEVDFVRLMVLHGVDDAKIAIYLGRSKIGIYQLRRKLAANGTLNNIDLPAFTARNRCRGTD